MPRAASVSISKFSATVEEAVKTAVQKHPKFKTDPGFAISHLIWGVPVPELLAANVTIKEAQSFAADLASQVSGGLPSAARVSGSGLYSHDGFLILGFPAPPEVLLER